MKQIIQDFKTGEIKILDLPASTVEDGRVLVSNSYSVVSAGTERGTVSTAQKNLVGKAFARPDLVRQVVNMARKKGFKSTLDKVRSKLDSFKALGYSCAGEVIAVGKGVENFRVGDRVACAGSGYASHAGIVSVPVNLVTEVPDGVDLKHAAFTTVGAIALQGVRQADISLGDNVAVIGLGLLGLIEIQLLKASGARVFGMDINDRVIGKAKELGCDSAVNINADNITDLCDGFTGGRGFDRVIITASTNSSQPVELAGEIVRPKGSVIIVGAVSMDIPRQVYYEKEVDIRLSRSYGPGRYDPRYEEQGIDYPYDYVRWTENRNMQAFLQLLRDKQVQLEPLITHTISIEDANRAYELITGKVDEDYLGLVIEYEQDSGALLSTNGQFEKQPVADNGEIRIGFIGAGNFAQTYLLPELDTRRKEGLKLCAIANSRGHSAAKIADKYQIPKALTDADEIFSSADINTVFIATRHHLHYQQLRMAMAASKNVYLEKPVTIDLNELRELAGDIQRADHLPVLLVGYNRRFSDLIAKVKTILADRQVPLSLTYRINAGKLPDNHWTKDRAVGGGRVLGEMCHFVDLASFLTDSSPCRVYAQAIGPDTVSATVTYEDGSIAAIHYFANGNDRQEKEYLEVFAEGRSIVVDDFSRARIYRGKKMQKIFASGGRDIGRSQIIAAFINACRSGKSPIPVKSLLETSLTTFMIEESIRQQAAIMFSLDSLLASAES